MTESSGLENIIVLRDHYISHVLETPSLWGGSPFVLARVRPPIFFAITLLKCTYQKSAFLDASRNQQRPKSEQRTSVLRPMEADSEFDTISFRFQCQRRGSRFESRH